MVLPNKREVTKMKECYIEKCVEHYGRSYGSRSYDKEKYGVFLKPYGILLRAFDTEQEAYNYKLSVEGEVIQ
jgi:hypothetical protein